MSIDQDVRRTSPATLPATPFEISTFRRTLFVFLSVGACMLEMAPAFAAGATAGCEPASGPAIAGGDTSFTVVALPDTQYYAAAHPAILEAQARWIVAQHDVANIAFVVHEGDIVDADEPGQWERAARSLRLLEVWSRTCSASATMTIGRREP
jgi:hypothetical protein